MDAIVAMGYEEPTPIQAQAIPPMLEGRDVVGQARTGTGKTAAFGIPLVDRLRDHAREDGVHGLVLLPTRELAIQVAEVLTDLAKKSGLSIVPIYGGVGFGKQLSDMDRRGSKILVACPGRLLDLVDRGVVDLSGVKVWVLDEADRMLDMGFVRDMRKVEALVPKDRHTALFSATFPKEVQSLVREFTRDAVRIAVGDGEATVPQIDQYHARVEKPAKTNALLHLLHEEQPARGIVFTRTKHLAKRLSKKLVTKGWSAVALQGNMSQGQRERAMGAFRNGSARILVATDVAARGLDVSGVTHVVNFDLPDEDSYVHRVGRTARNGAEGIAFTFVQSDEVKDFKAICRHIDRQVERFEAVTDEETPDGPDPKSDPAPPPQQNQGGGAGSGGGNGNKRRRKRPRSGQGGAPRQGHGPRHGHRQGNRNGGRSGGGQGGRGGQGGQGGQRRRQERRA
ncbi:MAG: DEAD/DEAH box helicase [Thermoplasmatota archaeon]